MKRKSKLLLLALLVLIMSTFFATSAFAAPRLNKTKHTMIAGESFTLKVTGTKKKVVWSSSNKKIATVSKTGKVKALKAGEVIIKAKVAGKTLKCKILVFGNKSQWVSSTLPNNSSSDTLIFTFHQDGWYVARFYAQVWDTKNQGFINICSDSCAIGQKCTLKIDISRYEVNRVGYQIWFFGWDNDYMNIPWANTNYATDFTLSGYGDYPEFTWK